MSTISEIEKILPRYLQNRFNSLNNYVWEVLFPESKQEYLFKRLRAIKKKVKTKLTRRFKDISDEATFVVYLFVLLRFFKSGSEAARTAVDIFKEFKIEAFSIGRKEFKDRNENVEEGENLATELISAIKDDRLRNMIIESSAIHEILEKYKSIIDNTPFINMG